MLFAFSIGRTGFGLAILVAFSIGLAVVLTAVGLTMVSLRGVVARSSRFQPLVRVLPVISALVVTALGLGIVVQGLVMAGVLVIRL